MDLYLNDKITLDPALDQREMLSKSMSWVAIAARPRAVRMTVRQWAMLGGPLYWGGVRVIVYEPGPTPAEVFIAQEIGA